MNSQSGFICGLRCTIRFYLRPSWIYEQPIRFYLWMMVYYQVLSQAILDLCTANHGLYVDDGVLSGFISGYLRSMNSQSGFICG